MVPGTLLPPLQDADFCSDFLLKQSGQKHDRLFYRQELFSLLISRSPWRRLTAPCITRDIMRSPCLQTGQLFQTSPSPQAKREGRDGKSYVRVKSSNKLCLTADVLTSSYHRLRNTRVSKLIILIIVIWGIWYHRLWGQWYQCPDLLLLHAQKIKGLLTDHFPVTQHSWAIISWYIAITQRATLESRKPRKPAWIWETHLH